MKTTILLALLFIVTLSQLHAQIDKGRVQIGGSVGFNHQQFPSGDYKLTSVDISPSAGVFYKTNQLAGAFINFDYNENYNGSNSINRSYGGGVFFRQYKPAIKNLYLFFDERVRYNYHYDTQSSSDSKYSSIGISVQPGLAYDITHRLQAEMFLSNFLNAGYSNERGVSYYYLSSSLESNLLNNVALGFRFYLR